MSLSVVFVSLVYLVPRSISYCVRASVFFYLTQSRKRVYADHAVQVRVAARVSAVSIVSLKKNPSGFLVVSLSRGNRPYHQLSAPLVCP